MKMKHVKRNAKIASITWTSCFVLLVVLKRDTIERMTLNEWGDLFSGFAAPLALIWLIVGYIQQGEELRLNTEALEAQHAEFQRNTEVLRAQQEELRKQAEATNELVKNMAKQAAATNSLVEMKIMGMAGSVLNEIIRKP